MGRAACGPVQGERRQGVRGRAERQGLQKDLRALAANIRADAEGRYDSAEPGWRSGVEWALLWIENTASHLTEGRPGAGAGGRGQGVSPE
ncbi:MULTISPECIES: hypothetical protein [Streptomyces]|uniref:hypothetical protein n=1 Tax=Streptomyces TaxID=1883 RepID=UPI0018F0E034|nr:hypothetical protein [Streptomyces sp. CRPSP2-6A1]MBJ7005745.1 hypothetical protein [Streptomyces sp. CRPSP2-6A1]